MTDGPSDDNPYAPPPPGWQPPTPPPAPPPPYGAPPGWQPPPPPYAAPPGWQPPPPYGAPPGWQPPPPPYGAAPAGYPPYGYQPYGYPRSQGTNGFAIAALLCALLLGVVPFVGGALGVTFGVIGLRQCARSGQPGRGLSLTGIIVGALSLLAWILIIGIGLAHGSDNSGTGLSTVIY